MIPVKPAEYTRLKLLPLSTEITFQHFNKPVKGLALNGLLIVE